MITEYRQLKIGEKIEKGDLIARYTCGTEVFWDNVFYHEIGKPYDNTMIVKREVFHKPILTELALHLIGENTKNGVVTKFIKRDQIRISWHPIILTEFAVDLLERKDREIQAEKVLRETPKHIVSKVHNHTTPIRKVRRIGESTGKADFDRIERDYHGHQKPLEMVTGGHLTRSLDSLIKSRS